MHPTDNPIHIVSWTQNFIPALGKAICEGCIHDSLENAIVVFPHRRAARYLTNYFKEQAIDSGRVLLPPTMISLEDFIPWGVRRVVAQAKSTAMPSRTLSRLDQAFALHRVVSSLPGIFKDPKTSQDMDMNRFLPWGMRLAGVMEDFFRQDLAPANLDHVRDEVADYAASLLGSLGNMFTAYERLLTECEWTTPGLQCRALARQADVLAESLADKDVFIAGFYALTGCEDRLFKALWHNGARIFWHSDPALCGSKRGHWACAEHADWAVRWKTRPEWSAQGNSATSSMIPPVRFIEGFDRHSQLAALQDELFEVVKKDGTAAVILPDTGLLAPLLRHLPDKDVNISMGYPLERSALYALLDLLMETHLQHEKHGQYPWNLLSEIVRHPFMGQLGAVDGIFPLRPLLRAMDRILRERGRDMDMEELVRTAKDNVENEDDTAIPPAVLELLEQWLDAFFCAYENRRTLAGLADALRETTSLLLNACAPVWEQRLIDAECLYRTLIETVPMMSTGLGQDIPLAPDVLYPLARQVMRGQSVSFEPEPLTGLQVLGLLETRLLSFNRLFILDATEDKLPGAADHDPLLPDTLRLYLQLPHSRERDNVAAYNFYRLLMSCDEAVICYPKGEHKGLLDSTHLRSRFVEQLLWEREKQLKQILAPGNDPDFTRKSFSLHPLASPSSAIEAGPAARQRIEQLVQKGVSATMLDTYMRCPKLFFHRYVLRLEPLEQANLDGDKKAFGELVHDVLKNFFKDHVGSETDLSALPAADLQEAFTSRLEQSGFFARMAPDAQTLLRLVGRERLGLFLKAQPKATVFFQEKNLRTTFPLQSYDGACQHIILKGTIDRCDARDKPESGMYILDYKTGMPKIPSSSFWEHESLWTDMQLARPEHTSNPDLLQQVAQAAGSVQLPMYCTLFRGNFDTTLANAGWINLADNGTEIFIFPEKCEQETRVDIMEHRFPMLLDYLLRHLLYSKSFEAIQGNHCGWCDFAHTCGH